jgi:O-methyltransferase
MTPRIFQSIFNLFGMEVVRRTAMPIEATDADRRTVQLVRPYTMTSSDRLWALIQSVRYVVAADIPGDLVECGVWRGGSSMAMARTLWECGKLDRRVWLYDTFKGMTNPLPVDVQTHSGRTAREALKKERKRSAHNTWCIASKDDVCANLRKTDYPSENLKLVEGDVRETLQRETPSQISVLRLDTDWYDSTLVELECLYPKLSTGGVCIIDDYGYWDGARKAVDEYLKKHRIHVLLNKIDEAGRIFVKPHASAK